MGKCRGALRAPLMAGDLFVRILDLFGGEMKGNSLTIKRSLEVNILPSRDEMGRAAAIDVARAMSRFIKEKGKSQRSLCCRPFAK